MSNAMYQSMTAFVDSAETQGRRPSPGIPVVYRAGAERFWSLCASSAATLEGTAAVVVLAVAIVKKSAAKKTAQAPTPASTDTGAQ